MAWLCAAAAVLAGCAGDGGADGSAAPHAAGAARAALSAPGFDWRTHAGPGFHLHYRPGSLAAARIHDFAREADEALRHVLALMGQAAPRAPLELFLVDSRAQARQLTGNEFMGQAVPGELTAFFVVLRERAPAFRHEIMHALSLTLWGPHRAGSWLSDGVAAWAAGSCQGKSVDAIAAGFLQRGELLPLAELAGRFWEVDELRAYMSAASAVNHLARTRGNAAVAALWKQRASPGGHPLGEDGARLERAWRAHLATLPPATVDTAQLRRHGC
ncbi:MAG TPA: hypothetical protein VF142_00365 [Longimicrobium sp.]